MTDYQALRPNSFNHFHLPGGSYVRAVKFQLFLCSILGALSLLSAQESEVTYPQLNEALGIELFADDCLWDDQDESVAGRLGWPLEGRTSTLSSYRYYPTDQYQILDTRAYTTALYCIDQKPNRISIMFSNKGDYSGFAGGEPTKDIIETFEDLLEQEEENLVKLLTGLFGEPERGKMGKGKLLRERLRRWDWKGHSILLSVQDDEYVALRITRPEFADNRGITDTVSDSELKKLLKSRVIHRDNGDVIVTDIPMVDQGPKGYCVPATWERYLRFLGIPADMYVLARAGSSGYGGGTYFKPISAAVDDLARDFKRKLDDVRADLSPDKLARYIDDGLPIMWAVYADSHLYRNGIHERTAKRAHVTDWNQWKAYLDEQRKAVKKMEGLRSGAHVCMIIGYNEQTQEIATSDSWGKLFSERWMTVEEAEAISQGRMQLIRW